MAEHAAHLTRTLQGTPSVFQVTAQEALGNTVKPALRKVVEYLSEVYPNKCGWTEQWFDELYLVFDTLLQYHYLKHYASSFSESFYGLVRVPLSMSTPEFSGQSRLAAVTERASLALLVLLPYVRDKVQRAVTSWMDHDDHGDDGRCVRARLRQAAIKLYCVSHLAAECAKLCQLAAYLCGRSRSHSPALAALRLALANAPPRRADLDEYSWGDLVRSVFTGRIGSAVVTFPMIGGVLLRGVEYGAFMVHLARWALGAGAGAGAGAGTLTATNYPQRDKESVRFSNKCPLCLRSWRVPTALPVSGYIFCYVCISRHVRARGVCPVTRCPTSEATLVRLYVD